MGADPLDAVVDPRPATDAAAEHHELAAALHRGLLALAPELRAAVVLRDVESLSTRQSAEILALSEAAFKSRLHRGRTELRDRLAPYLA